MIVPTQISPALYSLNEVLQSVVVLSVLIISLDTHNRAEYKIDRRYVLQKPNLDDFFINHII